ncbi:MAG: hypothetical protein ABSE72_03990 [Bacteroidales bacterium]|jgi:hypothetical protein
MNILSLYEKLNIVIKYHIEPDDIKFIIKEKPIIDTIDESQRQAMLMAEIKINNKTLTEVKKIKNALRIMYWKISEEIKSVKIVGIVWFDKTHVEIFEGEVFEP